MGNTKTKSKEEIQLEELKSSPYVVWLHNDDFNTFDHVIECMNSVCGHDMETSSQIAHMVHFKGKCDVKRGDKENMTKIYNILKTKGLTVTLETI